MQSSKQNLKKNIPLFYIYHFLSQIRVDNVLWLLYTQCRGLSLLEIGVCEAILHVSGLTFEIPTGAIGDLIGRKRSMMIGSGLIILTYILMLFAHSFFELRTCFFSTWLFNDVYLRIRYGSDLRYLQSFGNRNQLQKGCREFSCPTGTWRTFFKYDW